MKKHIVITGGTSGIGKGLVERFLNDGEIVFVISKSKEHILETKKELNNKNVFFIQADLIKEDDVTTAFKYIGEKTDKIDVLINNAAYDKMSSIEYYDYSEYKKIITTNLCGKFLCINKGLKLLKKSDYPSVINIASRLADRPMKDSAGYCSAAAGIVMLTKCAALEFEDYGIRVNCVSPSLTKTPLSVKSYSEEEILRTKNINPRKRLCEIDDIYEVIKFLISPNSDYINGENINVNGGILLK